MPAPVRAVLAAVLLAALGLGGGSLLFAGFLAAGLELAVLPETVLRVLLLQGLTFGGVAALYLRCRGLPLSYVGVRRPDLEGWIHEFYKHHGRAVDNLRNSIVHNVLKFRTDPEILEGLHEGER